MEPLLFLSHRIPFPPNKGDKIRSYHLLKHLAREYDIYLGTFVDDPDDRQHVSALREHCKDICAINIDPSRRKVASLSGFLSSKPLTVPFYANEELDRWVSDTVTSVGIRRAFVFSSAMAQFVIGKANLHLETVIDFVDVDSEKWRAYAESKAWPFSVIYRREASTLLEYESVTAKAAAHSLFVSDDEADLFRQITGIKENVSALCNGVDFEFFDPTIRFANPYPSSAPVLVFTGAMDHWANVDAVCWFAEAIFPDIRHEIPAAEFWIVGAKPTRAVENLTRIEGVSVTGQVDDVRPYIAHASAAVAPLRIARGIQNKVLEAMAMSKPVVGTPAAFEGIRLDTSYESLITENPDQFATACATILRSEDYDRLRNIGEQYVKNHHSWPHQCEVLSDVLKGAERH